MTNDRDGGDKWLGLLGVVLIVSVVLASSPILGRPYATIALGEIGRSVDAPVTVPEGTAVLFGMHADKFSYDGGRCVLLDVELLRDGAVVGTAHCCGFDLREPASGSDATQYDSSCGATVPAGGITALRVKTTLENPSAHVSLEGLAVVVKKK